MKDENETLKQINRSGFPFQLRIEQEIRASHSQHEWEVASREHPWNPPNNDSSGFIDLVLSHTTFPGDRLVIECKRVKAKDSRQLQWVFLLPDHDAKPTARAACFEVAGSSKREAEITEW